MKIKIFGERNTGTNALLQMLKINSGTEFYPGTMSEISTFKTKKVQLASRMGLSNLKKEQMIDEVFDGRLLTERWKHSATYVTDKEIGEIENSKFIFTVRNPISWLIGLYKKPYHMLVEKPSTLVEFSDIYWRVVKRENMKKNYYKPLEILEYKLNSYLNLMEILETKGIDYKILKFEDFVESQKKTFTYLKEFIDTPFSSFTELTKSTKESRKSSKYYADYYSNEFWKKDFPEFVNIENTISKDLLSVFGYK